MLCMSAYPRASLATGDVPERTMSGLNLSSLCYGLLLFVISFLEKYEMTVDTNKVFLACNDNSMGHKYGYGFLMQCELRVGACYALIPPVVTVNLTFGHE
jgi:hypothetical protein